MKKVTLALVAVTLSLSACTRVVEVEVAPSDPPETTTAEPVETPAPTSPPAPARSNDRYSTRAEFLSVLYEINPELDGYSMDADFFDGALGTCEALDSGMTLDDVVETAVESSGSDPELQMMFASVLATTLVVVCPEYEYMMAK